MENLVNSSPLILVLVFLVIGFVFLMKGADFFVEGSSSIAKRLKVPPIIIGLSGFNTAYIVQGALLVALAAIIVDRAFERLTRWISRHRHAQ